MSGIDERDPPRSDAEGTDAYGAAPAGGDPLESHAGTDWPTTPAEIPLVDHGPDGHVAAPDDAPPPRPHEPRRRGVSNGAMGADAQPSRPVAARAVPPVLVVEEAALH